MIVTFHSNVYLILVQKESVHNFEIRNTKDIDSVYHSIPNGASDVELTRSPPTTGDAYIGCLKFNDLV